MKKFFEVRKQEKILAGLVFILVIVLIMSLTIISSKSGKREMFLLKVNGELYSTVMERDSIITLQSGFIAFQEAKIDSLCLLRDMLIRRINQNNSDFQANFENIDFFIRGLLSEKALLERDNLKLQDELMLQNVIIEAFQGEGVGPRETVPDWVIKEEGFL